MIKKTIRTAILFLSSFLALDAQAQQTLTLEECRRMALETDLGLRQARTRIEMAGIDRKTALANYFPNISATGAYIHNHDGVALIGDDASAMLSNSGSLVQSKVQEFTGGLMEAVKSNPQALAEFSRNPMWQTFLGAISQTDISQTINALGKEIDDALHPDLSNVMVGVISLRQPVFAGGKIVTANKIAELAEDLSEASYDLKRDEVVSAVEKSYWQIVSISNKVKLTQAYADLLHKMERDVEISVKEGVATASDALGVRVKANEAEMLRTKAENGLALAKMLLCKQTGLDLESEIRLADEDSTEIPVPQTRPARSFDEIFSDRPETRSLGIATEIHQKKIAFARADMLPKVALTANYMMTSPNLKNGLGKDFGGFLSAGVAVSVPIFHGFEALQKTRKAKAEATLYRCQLEEARKMINLQVVQLRKQRSEALEKLAVTESNLRCAEENLRAAMIGFEEGVIEASTALAAQTAWLKANSERIDAAVEIQTLASELAKAEAVPSR